VLGSGEAEIRGEAVDGDIRQTGDEFLEPPHPGEGEEKTGTRGGPARDSQKCPATSANGLKTAETPGEEHEAVLPNCPGTSGGRAGRFR